MAMEIPPCVEDLPHDSEDLAFSSYIAGGIATPQPPAKIVIYVRIQLRSSIFSSIMMLRVIEEKTSDTIFFHIFPILFGAFLEISPFCVLSFPRGGPHPGSSATSDDDASGAGDPRGSGAAPGMAIVMMVLAWYVNGMIICM